MKLDTPILIIKGYQEKVGVMDWYLVKWLSDAGFTNVRVRECVQNSGTENEVTAADIAWAVVIYCYSWGVESLRILTANFTLNLTLCTLLVIVLGVSDPTGVFRSAWDLSAFKGRAICFQVTPDLSFPVSIPIKDASWQDFADYQTAPAITARLDVNCDELATQIPWYLAWVSGGTRITNHTTVMNDPALLTSCVTLLAAYPLIGV